MEIYTNVSKEYQPPLNFQRRKPIYYSPGDNAMMPVIMCSGGLWSKKNKSNN